MSTTNGELEDEDEERSGDLFVLLSQHSRWKAKSSFTHYLHCSTQRGWTARNDDEHSGREEQAFRSTIIDKLEDEEGRNLMHIW